MLDAIRHALSTYAPSSMPGAPRAAVLMPLIWDDGPPRLLLTRRAETLPTHKGQVAFPGGYMEAEDADATATALRESAEEIGLPIEAVEVLGRLDDLPAIDGRTQVTPVVGLVRDLPPLRLNPDEVAHVFTIPLAALARREGWRMELRDWRQQRVPVYFFPYFGELLWGLSAHFTLQLLRLTPLGKPAWNASAQRLQGAVRANLKGSSERGALPPFESIWRGPR
ncbi:CoA pyrophosphatase [Myxococcota bacterium]|nr:CoA pyrophosphatase [Myxococcota bacterium]MBU1432127.1 CoA pyrophosphatase [Myxococcota bacterium]MBU1900320.1 CoA pyrophosphatase [Myxococcota bacterium]